jgi:hypothetical protein
MLLAAGILEPGEGTMAIEYLVSFSLSVKVASCFLSLQFFLLEHYLISSKWGCCVFIFMFCRLLLVASIFVSDFLLLPSESENLQ